MVSPWFRFHNKRLREVQALGRKTASRYQAITCSREEYRQLKGNSEAKAVAIQGVVEWMGQDENRELIEMCVRVFGGSTLFTVKRIDGEFFEYIPGQKLQPITPLIRIASNDNDKAPK